MGESGGVPGGDGSEGKRVGSGWRQWGPPWGHGGTAGPHTIADVRQKLSPPKPVLKGGADRAMLAREAGPGERTVCPTVDQHFSGFGKFW